MSSNEKVSNVFGDSKEDVVTMPFSEKQLLRLVAGGVLLLLLSVASSQSKITYHFVPKFQQFIGTNREVHERVLALLFLKQVPGFSNRCMFSFGNGLSGSFISRY